MSILAYYRIQTTNKEIICPTHPHQRKKSSNGLIIFLVAVMLIVLGAVIYIWVDVSNAQRQQQQLDDLSSQIEQTKTKNDTSAQEAENQQACGRIANKCAELWWLSNQFFFSRKFKTLN